jgi:DNA-3-methyladenine glycosylase I
VGSDPLMADYHDREWGPGADDRLLFEFRSWKACKPAWQMTILASENFRRAFAGFDPRLWLFRATGIEALLADPGIVRNRLKVQAAVQNAQAFLQVQREFGSFDTYSWRFVGGKPRVNAWRTLNEIPAQSAEAIAFSKDLVKRGFRFVGPTICYAHMQATGMVNDHLVGCFRYQETQHLGSR